jgi:trans-2,3-dihydro-3-hydroxyanthranilate isomerase
LNYRYRVVDVFTSQPLEGNPLAVFPDARGMSDDTMQRVAQELNLSETAFVLPATSNDAAARVRIFTPTREMLFAGHPTIGTSWVLLDEGIVPRDASAFVLEELIGPVPVRVETTNGQPMIWLRTPPIRDGAMGDRVRCAQLLGLETGDLLEVTPQLLSAGNPTFFIALRDKAAVDRASIDSAGVAELRGTENSAMCVFVFTPTPEGAYSRMFAQEYGIIEDPATGSSTGPLAAYMLRHGLAPRADGTHFVSEQGTQMRRRSLLHVLIHGDGGKDGIEVGGHVTPLTVATMSLGSAP